MSEMIQESALCQAFACYRVESPSDDGSFSVESHSHYFSEVMLMRSGTCRVIRGSYTYILKPGELIYISPLVRHSVPFRPAFLLYGRSPCASVCSYEFPGRGNLAPG